MVGELLLRWMSESGTGRVPDLKDRAAWLARTADLPIRDFAFTSWLRTASALGHCEIDWDGGRWSVAPPAVARLPEADATAVLAGARRQPHIDQLDAALETEGMLSARRTGIQDEGQIPPPDTVMIWFDSESQLRSLSDRLGIRYAGCAASGIARMLPSVQLGALAAPPAAGTALEVLSSANPRRFAPAEPVASRHRDGLYRYKAHGRNRYLTRREGDWYDCDLSTGMALELVRLGTSALRWRPELGSGRDHVGTLLADAYVPIPALHERALVLCSGFPPRFQPMTEVYAYDNVPLTIARAVAASLGQRLQVRTRTEGTADD
jgi:hypothetical protein